jgi:aldehyde dehydrogenase (NAD+)
MLSKSTVTILARQASFTRIQSLSLRHVRWASTVPSQNLNINGRDVSIPTGLFINNEFCKSIGGNTFSVENPTTGKTIIDLQVGREEDVDVAVKAARTTFESKGWAGGNPVHRADLLRKLAALMERDKEDIIHLEMLDTGKTRRQAESLDFPASVGTLKYYAGWADKVQGLTSFNIPGTFAYTRREPVGVCGQIIPWKQVN